MVNLTWSGSIATIALNDPARRNALGRGMFDALEAALAEVAARQDASVLFVRGEGPAFCAGFDLAAAVDDPPLLGEFIERLSGVNRSLRRLPQVVIAAVQGAAIAGGCALLSACDVVVIEASAQVGYPVHALGISPAVTVPTLAQAVGSGPGRALLMSGRLISGAEAHQIGLASHLSEAGDLDQRANDLARVIAGHGLHALRVTKRWLNELDGSLEDARFDGPAADSARQALTPEAAAMLRARWVGRRS
jgi:methylglutaconyl-CoA hydratase